MTRSAAVAVDSLVNAVADVFRYCSGLPRRRMRSFTTGFNKVPRRYASLDSHVSLLAAPYMPALVEKRGRLLVAGRFGEIQSENWAVELGAFLDEMVLPRLGRDAPFAQRRLLYVAGLLDDLIAEAGRRAA